MLPTKEVFSHMFCDSGNVKTTSSFSDKIAASTLVFLAAAIDFFFLVFFLVHFLVQLATATACSGTLHLFIPKGS